MLCALSHSELRKVVVRLENSDHPDEDVHHTNPGGFHLAIAEDTEQRVSHKNKPSNRGEQNQYEKVVRVSLSHEVHIQQRTGNQEAAYESTGDCKTAESSALALNLLSLIHQLSLARSPSTQLGVARVHREFCSYFFRSNKAPALREDPCQGIGSILATLSGRKKADLFSSRKAPIMLLSDLTLLKT